MKELLTPEEQQIIQLVSSKGKVKFKDLIEEAKRGGISEEEALRSLLSLEQKGLIEGIVSLK
jgi:DeoR/GlpR family transcriptional regulator of sugar metabolism